MRVRATGESHRVAGDLLPCFLVPLVGELLVGPGVEREVRAGVREEVREALVDLDRLRAYGLGLNAVQQALQADQLQTPAGLLSISGRDVNIRLNALVTYRVGDARLAVSVVDDARQALYRETQLVLRALVGARELDGFLADKDGVVEELQDGLRRRVPALGLEVLTAGIRDIILPGEMKDLLNKVTEAKKAAEANLIVRREETAAMRSQANTAKLLQDNPTLMRLRELEVLEKVAATAKLSVVLGDKGLTERVVNVL